MNTSRKGRLFATVGGVEKHLHNRGNNSVQCDHPGCFAQIVTERTPDSLKLRAKAASLGWAFVDGKDLCPEHK